MQCVVARHLNSVTKQQKAKQITLSPRKRITVAYAFPAQVPGRDVSRAVLP